MSLLHEVETYLRRTATPPSRLGREAARDPRLVFDMRRGRQLRPETAARLRAAIGAAAAAPRATAADEGKAG